MVVMSALVTVAVVVTRMVVIVMVEVIVLEVVAMVVATGISDGCDSGGGLGMAGRLWWWTYERW